MYGRGGHFGHGSRSFVPQTQGGATYNLALIGLADSEKMFESLNGRRLWFR